MMVMNLMIRKIGMLCSYLRGGTVHFGRDGGIEMRKADAAVEIWVGSKYILGGCMYAIFVGKKLNICALGGMTDLPRYRFQSG